MAWDERFKHIIEHIIAGGKRYTDWAQINGRKKGNEEEMQKGGICGFLGNFGCFRVLLDGSGVGGFFWGIRVPLRRFGGLRGFKRPSSYLWGLMKPLYPLKMP